MSFTPRTAAEIRDSLLGYWAAEYTARGETLLTTAGSDAYLFASSVGVIQSLCDQQARQIARDILPDQASDEAISRFGYVYGIAQGVAVAARLTVTVTSAVAATYTIPAGSQMSWTDGLLYDVTSTSVVTSGGSPSGVINVVAATAGADATRARRDVLTWQSAPSGLDPTGTVASVVTSGSDAESFQDWAARIISRLRERPASGNQADWAAWVNDYTALAIEDVYVYPLLQPSGTDPAPIGSGTTGVLGCVTVVPIGPAQGDSVTNTRILGTGNTPGGALVEIHEYIEGTRRADGVVVPDGTQLRPVTMSASDYVIEAAQVGAQAVDMTITPNAANAFPFAFTATIDGTSTATSLVLTGNYTTGASNLASQPVLVNVGSAYYRGAYYRVVLPTGSFGGGNTTFDLTATPLPAIPSGTLYPAPGCWSALRTAIFALFDSLGPGDTSPPRRWPNEDNGARATLYRSALVAAAMSAQGVLSATVTTPGTDVAPAQKQIVTLGELLVTQ